jgi:hypothetical protein
MHFSSFSFFCNNFQIFNLFFHFFRKLPYHLNELLLDTEQSSIKCNYYNRTRVDVVQCILNLQINIKSVCGPLFIFAFDPGDYHQRLFVLFGIFDIFLRGEGKHSDTNAKMIGWLDVLWVCKRNSLKAKSKANNQTHVLKLRFRFFLRR